MNYIAGYLFYAFKSKLKAFQFMSFVVEEFLVKYFTNDLIGVMKLTFIFDRILENHYGLIWEVMQRAGVTTLYFSVSTFLTIFCTFIPTSSLNPIVDRIWDLFIVDGYRAILRVNLYFLELQKEAIFRTDPDLLMFFLKKLDHSPLSIYESLGEDDTMIQLRLLCFRKDKLLGFEFDYHQFDMLEHLYEEVYMRLAAFKKKNGF